MAMMSQIAERADELRSWIDNFSSGLEEPAISSLRALEQCIHNTLGPTDVLTDNVTYLLETQSTVNSLMDTSISQPMQQNAASRPSTDRTRLSRPKHGSKPLIQDGIMYNSYSVDTDAISQKQSVNYEDKRYQCGVCEYRAHRQDMVKMHMKVHTGEKPFKCQVCGYVSAYKNDVVKHMRVHSGEKPYKCGVCLQAFSQPSGLRTHMRTHTGQRPYKCSLCDVRMSQAGAIQQHIRLVHLKDHPYKCRYCTYSSGLASTLKIHERGHTGEKPYQCSHEGCDYRCSSRGGVIAHAKTHERIKNRTTQVLVAVEQTADGCELCDQGISHDADFEGNYKCVNCEFTATKCYELSQHKQECCSISPCAPVGTVDA